MFDISNQRIVPGAGNPNAKICIIGEAPGAEEDRSLKPFVGQAGTVLEQCLHAAGLTRNDCYITNTIKVRPKGNDIEPYYSTKTGLFTAAGKEWVDNLREELSSVRSNVLVPLGATALAALTGQRSISKYRGYVMESLSSFGKRKVIPAYHPAASLRGQYILRYYITADLRKAKAESIQPDIVRPLRNVIIPESCAEALEWINLMSQQPWLATDIEVMNFEVSAISFAPNSHTAVSISFESGVWTEEEEIALWLAVARLLENPAISKTLQNGIFDIHFLAVRCGIKVQGAIDDTMIAHHIMYPDMLKGLAFLVSLYGGSQAYYKDMVKFDNIKDES